MHASSNEINIRKIYDRRYVFHAEFGASAPPVQVCLDARMLVRGGTGVATYAAMLARCLGQAGAAPMVLTDECGADRHRWRRWAAALRGGARHTRPRAGELIRGWQGEGLVRRDMFREAQVYFDFHRRLMPVACDAPPAVMHWTYPVPLYLKGAINLYTVHDAIPLTHPELTGIRAPRHRLLLERVIERADRIVTVSEAARTAIADATACPSERIVSLSQAIELPLQKDPPLPASLRPGKFFIFCGTIEHRKNLIALARAHAASGTRLPLVIVGPDGWGAGAIRDELARLDKVVTLPWQPRTTLIALLRNARALLFPTLAEGFGLPIIEAMTLGTPVLTSRGGATEEVAGDAALLIDPRDEAELAVAITRLEQDDMLARRLQRAGFTRAERFALDGYARRLRHFYAEMMAQVPARQAAASYG